MAGGAGPAGSGPWRPTGERVPADHATRAGELPVGRADGGVHLLLRGPVPRGDGPPGRIPDVWLHLTCGGGGARGASARPGTYWRVEVASEGPCGETAPTTGCRGPAGPMVPGESPSLLATRPASGRSAPWPRRRAAPQRRTVGPLSGGRPPVHGPRWQPPAGGPGLPAVPPLGRLGTRTAPDARSPTHTRVGPRTRGPTHTRVHGHGPSPTRPPDRASVPGRGCRSGRMPVPGRGCRSGRMPARRPVPLPRHRRPVRRGPEASCP